MKNPSGKVFFLSLTFFLFISGFCLSDSQQELPETVLQNAVTQFNQGNMDSAVIYCRKVLNTPGINDTIKGEANTRLCLSLRRLGKYDEAMQYGQKAMENYKAAADSSGIASATIALAKIYNVTGNNQVAMDYYFQLLEYAESKKDTLLQGQLFGLIANVYMDIDQVEKGMEYYKKAITTLSHLNDETLYTDEINNLGIAFYERQQYDSALIYYQRAMKIYQKIGTEDAVAASLQNIGLTLIYLNQAAKGLQYMHRAYRIFNQLNLDRDKISVLLDLGTAFTKIGTRDSAIRYLQSALLLAKQIHHTYYQKESLLGLYELYLKQGEHQKALETYQEYVAFKDSIDNMKMQQTLLELDTKYKTAEKERQIEHMKYQKKVDDANNKLLITTITTVVIILIFIVLMLFFKRRKDHQLHQQKMLVYEKEKMLTKAELAEREAREKQMADELEFKTRQLASHAMNMMQKNRLLHEVTEAISERMKHVDEEGKTGLKAIKHKLEQSLNAEKDWELFKLYFEQINKDFFTKLKKINPNLTSHDYRLAALTKLNLSIKEMASVLNISPNSLKNARYRLKKKLQLEDEDSLTTVIRNL